MDQRTGPVLATRSALTGDDVVGAAVVRQRYDGPLAVRAEDDELVGTLRCRLPELYPLPEGLPADMEQVIKEIGRAEMAPRRASRAR